MHGLHIYAVTGVPLVRPGDDLGEVLGAALRGMGLQLQQGDILVVAHKVVSKAEGRLVDLRSVQPSEQARRLAAESGKDPRLCELILRESRAILRVRPGLVVAEHRLGFVCANAGIDRSNVAGTEPVVALLPEDPDASARRLRETLYRKTGVAVPVIVCDSHGRPFRDGAVGVCIGVAGLFPLLSEVGREDLYGFTLQHSEEAVADELAAAATLVMGQASEGVPAALVRGFFDARQAIRLLGSPEARAGLLLREPERDLFR